MVRKHEVESQLKTSEQQNADKDLRLADLEQRLKVMEVQAADLSGRVIAKEKSLADAYAQNLRLIEKVATLEEAVKDKRGIRELLEDRFESSRTHVDGRAHFYWGQALESVRDAEKLEAANKE